MNAEQLVALVTQILFVLVFLSTGWRTPRQRRRANVDSTLLFGAVALLVAETWVTEALGIKTQPRLLSAAGGALLMVLPYLLLRLVDDFTAVPPLLMRLAALGLAAIVAGLFLIPPPYPGLFVLVLVLDFAALTFYAANAFVRAARRSSGVTRRRMQAVAAGTISLGLVIVLAGLAAALPRLAGLGGALAGLVGLAAGIAYYVGFAPPSWLRRTWQEPEVRAFLERAAALPRLPTTAAIVDALEQGAAASLGVPRAVIGLWDEQAGELHYAGERGTVRTAPDALMGGRCFSSRRPFFTEDAMRDDPEHAKVYTQGGARAVLAAPITAGTVRLGVLVVWAERAPIFADDDLVLVRLLADQAAVILESRALIDATARIQAREAATRLKDDFLSAAAHDLKTPLTALLAQAQLMERRAARDPAAPADREAIALMVEEAQRLKRLTLELLDVTRVEQGMLLGGRERVDLVSMAQEVCAGLPAARERCRVEADGPVLVEVDPHRIMQLIENLVENAAYYSPDGGEILLRVAQQGGTAGLSVTDQGIGIPAVDMRYLFERFHRGSNVNDRNFAGLGVGLYICRGIVEQHQGRLWATSDGPGRGSTFHMELAAVYAPGVSGQWALSGQAETA